MRKSVLVIAILVAAFAPAAPSSAGAFPGVNGLIAFARDGDIWVMNPDGSGQTALTGGSAGDGAPSWAPDGTRIAFQRCFSDGCRLLVMNADGSGVTDLSVVMQVYGDTPSWTQDGRIVFHSMHPGFDNNIYVVSPDGTGLELVTAGYSAAYTGGEAVFETVAGLVRDGSTLTTGKRPSWAPDSSSIAFHDWDGKAGAFIVHTVQPDGTGRRALTGGKRASSRNAGWSPDGTRILFDSDRGGDFEIYSMAPDGSGVTNLTNDPARDTDPDWQTKPPYLPDGSVKRASAATFVGDDLYNDTGVGQTSSATLLPGGKARFVVRVENDGAQTDSPTLAGCSGGRRFAVRYLDADGADVTAELAEGTYVLDELSSGGHDRVTAIVRARKTAPSGAAKDCRVRSVSAGDTKRLDVVLIAVVVR
jgi:dipeptidyl aminopeptidase/acylaminoacyl peptidase